MMRVLKVSARLFRLHLAGALHQNACDDLEALGDPMLDFLQKYGLLANEIVLLPGFGSRKSNVGNREKEPDAGVVAVVELAGVRH